MRERLSALIGLSLALGLASPLWAQSLGDVAKKEEERRKAIATPAKVYTNKDLTALPASATPPSESTPAAGTPATTPEAGAKDADKSADKSKDGKDAAAGGKDAPVKDQKYWSGRLKTLQDQLDRDSSFADALQVKINALTADFTARDDPAQRAVIERDRLKAVSDLDRLKKAIDDDKKALADLQEEARRAGVPPGWLR
ncbi:MAG: hypothetical protein HY047_01925 [Acidobacteria bacterium]|nr:hypothetical protein [Acidobacteriota bacterium]